MSRGSITAMKISARRAVVAAATAFAAFAATPWPATAGSPSTITEAAEDEPGDLHHASSEGLSTLGGFENRQRKPYEAEAGSGRSKERIAEAEQTGEPPLKHRISAQHRRARWRRKKRNAQRMDLGASERGGVASFGPEIKWAEDETGGAAAGNRFPPLEDSTVMFLHVFKCAGSTLRQMFVDWANAEGESGAIVTSCDDVRKEGVICLESHELIEESVQMEMLSKQKVLAGHFIWGFQRRVERPFLMVTSLRNPLEAFVSGRQFLHPDMTETLDQAQAFVSDAMLKAMGINGPGAVVTRGKRATLGHKGRALLRGGRDTPDQLGGFIFRLVGREKAKKLHGLALSRAADEAMENLEAFWLVGVVEQYAGLQAVLKRLLDPDLRHPALWDKYSYRHSNRSPLDSRHVLAAIDPGLVHHFNGSLALQWKVYEKAVGLWDARCREVLPITMHDAMCTVAPAGSRYS